MPASTIPFGRLLLATSALLGTHCNATSVDFGHDVAPIDARAVESGPTPNRDAGSVPFDAGPVEPGPPPPAVSGGTLLVLHDGVTAVAADPGRDTVWFVDLATATMTSQVALRAGDEPGRIAEDAAGRVHIALRRGGAVVTLDATSHALVERRDVCAAPRGIAYQSSTDSILVACTSGELVTLPAAGGAATRIWHLDDDLRDVVIDRGTVYVSRFRSAELLTVASDGTFTRTRPPTIGSDPMAGMLEPDVAWRTIAMPNGGVLMLHQRATTATISVSEGGYAAGGCRGSGIVPSAITVFDGASPPTTGGGMSFVLGVDVAADSMGNVAYVAPSDPMTPSGRTFPVAVAPLTMFTMSPCGGLLPPSTAVHGEPAAVAFDPSGRMIVQTREPASIQIVDWHMNTAVTISLPGASLADTGHSLFHRPTNGSIACASCHPEGGDDGRVWTFEGLGARRTQNLRGGVLARPPFHWNGDQADFPTLVHTVFTQRMAGGELTGDQVASLARWIDAQPELPIAPARDPESAMRGRTLFESPYVGCTSCHSGPALSNGQLTDVGTGGTFKVPSLLGVRWRAPYMHNGCAATLTDRFGPCGGTMHGSTAGMTAAQIADLVAYLETL